MRQQVIKLKVGKLESKGVAKIWRINKSNIKKRLVMRAVVEEGGYLEMKGKIVIGKNIADVDVFLEQRVLLMGVGARAVVIPELEIESNEVKAGHATSVGQIDQEQLFYLTSRGLTRELAVKLLIEAFLA
ncbi:MAG: SufD family Fe-S cluster assembly protein [Candidatus Shapirobacteria bacterium]|jgi:Fe-S cluster assembly scaffold protein SufB